ncbi:MAG: serine/threonine-protein phosphatase [Synechococcaceae cyanobacterium RL_1_2]|nr:serine/threonine-protein phosphatase [Synechococcaceae cyanobacterium RL_1_2]
MRSQSRLSNERSRRRLFHHWYGVFNRQIKRLVYGSAGHPPGCIIGKNQTRLLNSLDVPIGMVEGIDFSQEMVSIEEGESIYIFSDGVYEIEHSPDQLWGMDNFISYLSNIHYRSENPCQEILAHAQNVHWKKSLDDDFSLLKVNLIG